jgi:hypothetical protein
MKFKALITVGTSTASKVSCDKHQTVPTNRYTAAISAFEVLDATRDLYRSACALDTEQRRFICSGK